MKRKTMVQQARRRSASAKSLESKIFKPKIVPSAKVYDRKKQGKPDDS
jgi:hypothetical protein